MHFSIVIPSCERADLLVACLASIQRHAPAGTEVIVVDDGSINAFIADTAQQFADVRVVRRAHRKGFCAAVNSGVAAAHGDIVELLNDDTEVNPGWANAILPWFRDPTIGAVAPLVLIGPDGDLIDSAGDRYYVGGVAGKLGHGDPVQLAPDRASRVFGASGSSAFYRREALLQIGGFPENFKAYFDDVDVAFRLNRAGWKTIYEPAARVLHRVSATFGKPQGKLLEMQSLNEERVYWRNLPGKELRRGLPRHLAVLAGKAWRRWREGNLGPFLRGRALLLAEVGQLLSHRRQLTKLGPDADLEMWGIERQFWG